MSKKKIQVVVINNNDIEENCEQNIYMEEQNQTLLHVLQENNIILHHICNGNGTCGKCKIKVTSGKLPITEADIRCISKKELEQGIRLACKAKIKEIIEINSNDEIILELIEEMEENIVAESVEMNMYKRQKSKKQYFKIDDEQKTGGNEVGLSMCEEKTYFIAIDIGTTTIAMALVDEKTGEVCDTYTSLNHQRKYGADVLSRISAANSGKTEELKRLIEEDLWNGICKLNVRNISCIVICGNATMIHLLMGYSCERLGKYPFVSECLEKIECTLKEIIVLGNSKQKDKNVEKCQYEMYEKNKNNPVTILPSVSAFVGGDVVADVLVCPGFETEELSLLIDLGTNGEMVLGNKDKMLATSTAAGPAFEGGNIVCGMASVPGSISRVKIQNQRAVIKTIQDKLPPKGICGTGLISAISQLKQNNIIDEKGTLKCPYQKQGYPLWIFEHGEKIIVYQQDIREFQMAKSAIRAGIEILMEKYGCTANEISHVYLAGGFGVNLTEEDAIYTGILPEEFRGKTESVGNGAIKGSILYGMEKQMLIDKKVESMIKRIKHISLAEEQSFQEKYLQFL